MNDLIMLCLNNFLHHFFPFFIFFAFCNFDSFLLSTVTLYLSKSFSCCLLACLAKALPKLLSLNVFCTFSFAITLFSLPLLIPRPTAKTCLVSCNLLMGMTCRLMPYPSTKTLLSLRISTIVASFPSRGP